MIAPDPPAPMVRPAFRGRRALVPLLAGVFLFMSGLTRGGPEGSPSAPGLKLGLVDNEPTPGRPRVPLEEAVSQVRHNYGRFTLARFTADQEERLRAAGYAVRVFEDPDRIGVGPYSFRVPPGPRDLPPDMLADESRSKVGTFLVKLIGPARDEWLEMIRNRSGEILTPIPSFTYLVRFPPREESRIAALPFVEWTGPYHPAFKLSGELARRVQEANLASETVKLTVLIYRSADVDGVLNQIQAMRGEIVSRTPLDFYDMTNVRISARLIPDLARLPGVYTLETAMEPKLEDESSTQILAGQVDAGGVPFRPALGQASYNDWLSARTLDGSNVTIGYVDNGILNNDPTGHLSGRVNESVCGPAGADGHGHFGAVTAGGACNDTPEGATGFHYGLGVAPGVSFINLPGLRTGSACPVDPNTTSTLSTLARLTVTNNGPNGVPGSIQNNSWGAGGFASSGGADVAEDVSYQAAERTVDLLTRDADSVAGGNQPLAICFSAGNEGNTTPNAPGVNPAIDAAATLTRPHVGKNIFTTGASSVYRPPNSATNIADRCFFSSQGPTMDGRIKPDFMAPGGGPNSSAISSATVSGFGAAVGDGLHSFSAGTSFSTPQTAGGAALLTQWWKRFAPANPSPAMIKALLINSARDMQGGNTPDFVPNRHEGWGLWNLGNIIEAGTPTVVSTPPLFKKTSGLGAIYLDQGVVFGANGDQYQVRLVPSDLTKPLRATLVWTDAAGAVGSCPSLVNDLDLELVQNGKLSFRGNAITDGVSVAGGPADARNNVEQVIQANPSGFYTLTVRAVALGGDGIPGNADTTDQDFALVATNAVVYTGPILAAGAVTPTDVCSGTGSGGNAVIDPGETVVFSLPLVNSGTASASAVSGTLATSTPGISILDGASAYADIAAGATGNPNSGDTLSFLVSDTVPCGSGVDLTFNVSTAQGGFAVPLHFDVGSKTVTTQNLTGTTGAVNNDINNPSVFTTLSATAGTVQSVNVDVNISNPTNGRGSAYLFGDYVAELISPQATPVTLHLNPLPCSSLNTNFPNNRLAQIGTLDTFKGQNAGGTWSLRVTSRNNSLCSGGGPQGPCSSATVNSWTLHVTRETTAACNTCIVATPPPEVSAPGSPTLLTLTRNDSNGMVTFTWENQGSLSDSYRLYQGTIGSLAGTGVTSSNTAPMRCGIVTSSVSLIPAFGDLFFLVAGQKGAMIGPLGNATNPAMFPRSANQTCP